MRKILIAAMAAVQSIPVLAPPVLAIAPAAAQQLQPSAAPQAAPIIDGHRVAPRPPGVPQHANDDDAAKLLATTPDPGPPVQPHDIYGNPLGDTTAPARQSPQTQENRP